MRTKAMEKVTRIASFTVNHDLLTEGIYISRIDGDIVTYDLRTRVPNGGDYMSSIAMHSVEHMFATYIRNSDIGERVIYFGPMGCRTGFYLLVRGLSPETVLSAVRACLERIISHEGEVFGKSRVECGNYLELSIDEAKSEAKRYLCVLNSRKQDFKYKE